jgi:hypothetical protein
VTAAEQKDQKELGQGLSDSCREDRSEGGSRIAVE